MSTFTWLNKQGVQSDRGFSFQFTGRFTAEYREDGKRVTLRVESGQSGGLQAIILDPDAFGHWAGESANIPAGQQQQMFQNTQEALEAGTVQDTESFGKHFPARIPEAG